MSRHSVADIAGLHAQASPAYFEREVTYPFGNTIPVSVTLPRAVEEHPGLPVDQPLRVWVNAFGAVCAIDPDGFLLHLPPGTYTVAQTHELSLDLTL